MQPDDGRYLTIEIHRRPGRGGIGPQSWALLTYSFDEHPMLNPVDVLALGRADAPVGPAPPPVPSDWAPLPPTGQPFRATEIDPLVVEEGSHLIVPTSIGPDLGCSNRSFVTLLAIDGDPGDVVDAYAQQVAAGPGRPIPTAPPEQGSVTVDGPGGTRITITNLMAITSVGYSFRVVERPGADALLQITSCQG